MLLAAAAAVLVLAPPAQAGTYEVRACRTPSGVAPNRSWDFSVPSGNWATGQTCPASKPELVLLMNGNTATPAGQRATMTFRPPAGAKIRDFVLTRWVYYYNPTRDPGTAPPDILYSFGPTAFAGAGEYDAATRDAINATGHWYGYPSGALDTGTTDVSKATFGRLTGQPDADSLTIEVGCWVTPCSLAGNANVFTTLYGARVIVADSSRPALRAGGGLLGGGSLGGDEAAPFSASDNVGIRLAELVDMTGAPRVVGRRVFPCDYSRPKPCANVSSGGLAPGSRLSSGVHALSVRVADTAGNQALSAPRSVFVGGPLNGANASESGSLRAVFTRGGKRRRTVGPGGRPSVSLRLRNGGRQPIGDARLQVYARQLRTGARYQPAGEVRTGANGRARFVVPKGASRALRFEYRRRVDDPQPVLRAKVRLGVRPRVSLRVRPRRVRFGGRIRLAGRVISRPRPRPGKLVVLQAFDRGRWRPLATARSGKNGRFAHAYRFTRTSRPRTFRFRARLPREAAYPYATGNSRVVRARVG